MGSCFLEDDAGNKSSMRLKSFLVTVTFLIIWGIASALKGVVADVPWPILTFVGAFNGLNIVQRVFGEKCPTPDPPAPKPPGG